MSDLTQSALQSEQNLASKIDHTLLRPEALASDYEAHCKDALDYGFFSVCVPPAYVPLAKKRLKGSPVKVCSVVGFPHGLHESSTKVFEAKRILDCGADEIDMVMNISAFKSGETTLVLSEIDSIVKTAQGKIVKVIIETAYLSPDQIEAAAKLCEAAGAHFVKTSTGFASRGASQEDIILLKKVLSAKTGIKASGGIRSREQALLMLQLGATRLGTSQSVAIVKPENQIEKNSSGTY